MKKSEKHGEKFMLLAIREARKGIRKKEGGPFGACIIRGGKVVAYAHNEVLLDHCVVSHAEIKAITKASRKLKKWDLSGCEIYSTTEPCTMCFSAIHWARIEKVYFGTTIKDAKKIGFNEMMIPDEKMKKIGKSSVKIIEGVLREECLALFSEWKKARGKKY
ncbi:MAG: nucleoside deaminase [Candidatus Diapherotrites archaeon]|nr:nucleoside deaminase [Candidatus Diapherotrites archaeon]